MEKATLKQIEFIQGLTKRPFIGTLTFEEISERIGRDVWDLDKKEASDLINRLSTREGLDNFLEQSK